ncbi:PIN domain-containing protein [Burkholderia sp. LMG 32019]|uniref:PIN domain-containing protein n=1 Tax=Burkholderia sp. LMG 32019 TaxID=3158173 RepID=UPI003C2BBC23
MLDTNVLFDEGSGDQFFSPAIEGVISDGAYSNINIHWIIPEMVRMEREYQLRQKARHIVSKAKEMPSIFSSTWVGDVEKVNEAIANHAKNEMRRLQVLEHNCDPDSVDWPKVIKSAGLRLPPFDPDDKNEKGFKDVIVAETFIQFCENLSPFGHQTAILVTKDAMLASHVSARVRLPNKVLTSVGALINELNFIVADIDPEQSVDLSRLAGELIRGNGDFWADVGAQVLPFVTQPQIVFGVSDVKMGEAVYYSPIFLRKHMKTVYFSFVLSYPRTGKIWVLDPPPGGLFSLGATPALPNPLNQKGPHLFGGPSSLQTPPLEGWRPWPPPQQGFVSDPVPLPPNTFPEGGLQTRPGHFEEVPLSPLNFTVHWSAYYEMEKHGDAMVPKIGQPILGEITSQL